MFGCRDDNHQKKRHMGVGMIFVKEK
ncbi:hypothetical protein TIFTF001_020713, partial [Ficus carica]